MLAVSDVLAWISNAANAVSEYFGRFPVEHPRVMVRPSEGRGGVFHGTTFGGRGGFTRISVGQATTEKQLDDDWMMTHEFIHMAFPDVSGESDSIIGWKRAWPPTLSRSRGRRSGA